MAALKPGKRRRSPSPIYETGRRIKKGKHSDDDEDDSDDTMSWFMRPDPVKPANMATMSSPPVPVPSMTKQQQQPYMQRQPSPVKRIVNKKRTVKTEQRDSTLENIFKEPNLPQKQCKFAKAG